MKFPFAITAALVALVSLALTGCAAAPPAARQVHREAIQQTARIEIFYNAEELTVIHDFGQTTRSNMVGLSGLFGPVGIIVATATSYAATKAAFDRVPERSRAFMAATQAPRQSQDMNREFARELGAQLERAGKTVKLTEVARLPGVRPGLPPLPTERVSAPVGGPTGSAGGASREMPPRAGMAPSMLVADNGYTATPGYTPLLLRISTGYGASEALAAFKSYVVVEYALVNPANGRYLTDGKSIARNEPAGPTYLVWESLLVDAIKARQQVQKSLFAMQQQVFREVFDFDALAARN
ncbi:MAG: hypothetical protein ABIU07_01605 [Ramlibacter sp.]